MKYLIIVAALLLSLPVAAFPAEPGTARVSLLKGDVQVHTEDTEDWVPASINMPLDVGDRLWSPEGGRSEVQVRGGIYLRLDGGTSLDVIALEEDALQFQLTEGRIYVNNRRGGIDHIQIDTPLTSVSGYDNSLIMIDVTSRGATDISILKGYAFAETSRGRVRVAAGNSLRIEPDGFAELAPINAPDKWERWNHTRDKKLDEAGESLRYLPDELDDYAYEFDSSGRWVYVSDYGYCWRPTVGITVDWSPYRQGRWVWSRGEYVWISHEQWGWAPHHYGRWAHTAAFGWCWVPPRRGAVYWSPGYVGWVHTPSTVAWVPLAPGETYYGRRNYGPGSVNITSINVNITTITHRNVNVRNAVTVIQRDDFISGRVRPQRGRENPFLTLRSTPAAASIGPPAVRPDRRATVPAIRRIPEASRPPERVKLRTPVVVREERRLRRSEGESGFKPERPSVNLPVRERREPRQPLPVAPRERQPEVKRESTERGGAPAAPAAQQQTSGRPERRREAPAATEGRSPRPAPAAAPAPQPAQPAGQQPKAPEAKRESAGREGGTAPAARQRRSGGRQDGAVKSEGRSQKPESRETPDSQPRVRQRESREPAEGRSEGRSEEGQPRQTDHERRR